MRGFGAYSQACDLLTDRGLGARYDCASSTRQVGVVGAADPRVAARAQAHAGSNRLFP